ncbi:MAG: prephenate dehydrogenase/arogenate dehydrogenase family protein, partial [Nitriliruptoraceae bacterium]
MSEPSATGPELPGGIRRVAVLGAGLVGGSIALAVRAVAEAAGPNAGVEVVVTDADPAVRDQARELALARVTDRLESAVAGADLVIAAVPTSAVAEVLDAAARAAPPTALLTDAASLKARTTA